MTNRAQATAASGDIIIDNETYQMSPLSDEDIGELDNWLRIRVIKLARASLTGEESDAERKSVMQSAFDYASSLTWLTKGIDEMLTLDGVARFLKQTLKKNHPELDVAWLRKCIVDNKIDLSDMTDIFDLLNDIPEEPDKKKEKRRIRNKKRKVEKKKRKSAVRKSIKG